MSQLDSVVSAQCGGLMHSFKLTKPENYNYTSGPTPTVDRWMFAAREGISNMKNHLGTTGYFNYYQDENNEDWFFFIHNGKPFVDDSELINALIPNNSGQAGNALQGGGTKIVSYHLSMLNPELVFVSIDENGKVSAARCYTDKNNHWNREICSQVWEKRIKKLLPNERKFRVGYFWRTDLKENINRRYFDTSDVNVLAQICGDLLDDVSVYFGEKQLGCSSYGGRGKPLTGSDLASAVKRYASLESAKGEGGSNYRRVMSKRDYAGCYLPDGHEFKWKSQPFPFRVDTGFTAEDVVVEATVQVYEGRMAVEGEKGDLKHNDQWFANVRAYGNYKKGSGSGGGRQPTQKVFLTISGKGSEEMSEEEVIRWHRCEDNPVSIISRSPEQYMVALGCNYIAFDRRVAGTEFQPFAIISFKVIEAPKLSFQPSVDSEPDVRDFSPRELSSLMNRSAAFHVDSSRARSLVAEAVKYLKPTTPKELRDLCADLFKINEEDEIDLFEEWEKNRVVRRRDNPYVAYDPTTGEKFDRFFHVGKTKILLIVDTRNNVSVDAKSITLTDSTRGITVKEYDYTVSADAEESMLNLATKLGIQTNRSLRAIAFRVENLRRLSPDGNGYVPITFEEYDPSSGDCEPTRGVRVGVNGYPMHLGWVDEVPVKKQDKKSGKPLNGKNQTNDTEDAIVKRKSKASSFCSRFPSIFGEYFPDIKRFRPNRENALVQQLFLRKLPDGRSAPGSDVYLARITLHRRIETMARNLYEIMIALDPENKLSISHISDIEGYHENSNFDYATNQLILKQLAQTDGELYDIQNLLMKEVEEVTEKSVAQNCETSAV